MKVANIPTGPLMVNTYLAYDEDSKKGFILDPGGYDEKITEIIKKEGIDIEYIILTHGHGDHIGGVSGFMTEFPNAKIVASEIEGEMLKNAETNMSIVTLGKPVVIHPHISVKDGDKLPLGPKELKFILTPGHTEGGLCVLVDDILFSGDTLFQSSIGRTDFPGGSFEAIKDAIQNKLFILPDETKVYPGHMGPTTIGYEKKNNPFV